MAVYRWTGLAWHADGESVENVPPGEHLIEFRRRELRHAAPLAVMVGTQTGQSNPGQCIGRARLWGEPVAIQVDVSLGADTLPYAYSGQIAADGDVFGTGCAVKEKVVLTAAHVVWDERTKTNRTGLRWLHLRHKRTARITRARPARRLHHVRLRRPAPGEPNPNQVSLATRDLDVAALYFLDPAARGGYAGYLVSGPTACGTTNWLELQRNALLVGYPLGRIKEDFGKMHKHGPDLYALRA